MPTNDFLPFATGGSANVISQAAYLALAARAAGFTTGTALSDELNKVWRQSAFQAAVVSQFVANVLSINVNDDGNMSAAVTNFTNAVEALVNAAAGNYDPAGAAAAAQAASDPAGSAAAVLSSSLQKAANLSDLASVATALANLGISLQGIAKAWVRFDATTGSVANSFGPISGVTRLSSGTFQVNFSITIPTNSYLSIPTAPAVAGIGESARTTTTCTFETYDTSNHSIVDATGDANILFFW